MPPYRLVLCFPYLLQLDLSHITPQLLEAFKHHHCLHVLAIFANISITNCSHHGLLATRKRLKPAHSHNHPRLVYSYSATIRSKQAVWSVYGLASGVNAKQVHATPSPSPSLWTAPPSYSTTRYHFCSKTSNSGISWWPLSVPSLSRLTLDCKLPLPMSS